MLDMHLPDGLWLLVWGGLLLLLRQFASLLLDGLLRFVVCTVEISERDSPEVYRWFAEWLGHQSFVEHFTKLQVGLAEGHAVERKVMKKFMKAAAKAGQDPLVAGGLKERRAVLFIPGFGTHVFAYRRTLVVCAISREKEGLLAGSSGAPGPNRTVTLWAAAAMAPALKELILEARDRAHDQENSEVGVFMPDPRGQVWRRALSISKIPFDSVILPEGVAEGVLADCAEFMAAKEWYAERGVPYRRGYLLYGPPGSGKSSFVHALASELGLDVCVVGIASGTVTDQGLQLLLNAAPASSVLLLEDVDVLFPDRASEGTGVGGGGGGGAELRTFLRGERGERGGPMLTMSGLLNALDGISGQQGRMVFMTTNFVDRLDEALVRSGRVDIKRLFGLPDRPQVRRIFLKFFPQEKDLAESFADAVADRVTKRPSMADLQGYLLKNKDDPPRAMANVIAYFNSP